MRVVLRADASRAEGSGHVMRCLTLAEALVARGHEVQLAVTVEGIDWLSETVEGTRLPRIAVRPDELSADALLAVDPDWVVIDSYLLSAEQISGLGARVPVLAIVDGELRGIRASLYLEQNLGSDELDWDLPAGARLLAGAEYALIRDAVLAQRRPEPWRIDGRPRVVVVLGGTDPLGLIVPVAAELASLVEPVELTLVAAAERRDAVAGLLAGHRCARIISPSAALAEVLGAADIVVSAAGTSAWEVCTLGLPAVLIAVVHNQAESLQAMVERGLVRGIDLSVDGSSGLDRLAELVGALAEDETSRRRLSERAIALFDGRGKLRVVEAMESGALRRAS